MKERLHVSYDRLAKMLGVGKSTIIYYKKGGTLPLSIYRKIEFYLEKSFPYRELLDPHWGQKKGGLISKARGNSQAN
ncbi:hypothetical protein KEJ25_08690 [Candidatus Bathyarchaeota archaeon]|nr:hypothetical protein [Candidatus Bathyarchaeota archaeon]